MKLGEWAFVVAGLTACNSLQWSIHNSQSVNSFKTALNTFLFSVNNWLFYILAWFFNVFCMAPLNWSLYYGAV